jgi:hypothetical protein
MRRKSQEGVYALARIACALSLSETLTEAKKLHENGNFAYVVRVPFKMSKDYVAAAVDLAKLIPGVDAFEVAAPFQTTRGKTDFGDVTPSLRNFERILVIVAENLSIPRSVFAASDRRGSRTPPARSSLRRPCDAVLDLEFAAALRDPTCRRQFGDSLSVPWKKKIDKKRT